MYLLSVALIPCSKPAYTDGEIVIGLLFNLLAVEYQYHVYVIQCIICCLEQGPALNKGQPYLHVHVHVDAGSRLNLFLVEIRTGI